MPSRIEKDVLPQLTAEDQKLLALRGLEFDALKKVEKETKTKLAECRTPLEVAVAKFGKIMPSGSKLLRLPYTDVTVDINYTLRTGATLLPEAIDILKKEPTLKDCVEDVPTIRMDRLEALIEAKKVPDDVLKKLFVSTENYAFSVKVKKGTKDEME